MNEIGEYMHIEQKLLSFFVLHSRKIRRQVCMKIGIIEDDNLLRKALDTSLKNQGYTTIFAASRKEAIKNIDNSVDLLIVDIGLPDGDGINLYQELQKK